MAGPLETELPSDFRRREKLRLTLHRSISEPEDLKDRVKTITCDELARKIRASNTKHRQPYLLLDCRGFLCYAERHIQGSVHIACTDRFNRKRVQNSGSVLDLVSTNNNRRNGNGKAVHHGKWRDVIVYDEGTTDITVDSGWQTPISFVLMHLLQENRQPIFLKGKCNDALFYCFFLNSPLVRFGLDMHHLYIRIYPTEEKSRQDEADRFHCMDQSYSDFILEIVMNELTKSAPFKLNLCEEFCPGESHKPFWPWG